MSLASQGYQLLAIGPPRYLEMAVSCAASIRYWDQTRPIQLVTDAAAATLLQYRSLFDVVSAFSPQPDFDGPLMKLLLGDHAIYDETMFVDADCLFLKPDIGSYWDELSSKYQATLPGKKRAKGVWYGRPIPEICSKTGTQYLVQLNSGVVFYKNTRSGRLLFDCARQLYAELGNFTGHVHRRLGPSDEPYLGTAMAKLGIEPFRTRDSAGNAWMISTLSSSEHRLDAFSGSPSFVKGGQVSPTICHFVSLRPTELYWSVSNQFLAQAGLPPVPSAP